MSSAPVIPSAAKPFSSAVFSLVKILLLSRGSWPQTSMAAGRNLPSNTLSWNDKAADYIVRAAALSCPQALCHGAFSPLCDVPDRGADIPERGKTDATSLIRREGRILPAQAPMSRIWPSSRLNARGAMLRCNKSGSKATLALPRGHHYHEMQLSTLGTDR